MLYSHNLKIVLLGDDGNIIEDKDFLDMIKNKLCKMNTIKLEYNGKPFDVSIKWDRKSLTNVNAYFMGDLFSEPVYEQDSIISKHVEQIISSVNIDKKYNIEFYIHRLIRDRYNII